MKKDEYEKELHKLYNMAFEQNNVRLCLDILEILRCGDFALPPLEIPTER